MTPGTRALTRRATLGLGAAGLLALLGCDPRQAAYFLQPFEPQVPPACPALKGKRVVLIAKMAQGSGSDFVTLDRDLTRSLATILREKIKKIDLVDPEKTWAWDQAHPNWSDPAELAVAFEADMVVFIEIAHFQIESPSSPGMYEGHASTHMRVFERTHPTDTNGKPMTDLPKECKVIYEGDRESTFPKRGPVPVSSEVTSIVFKNRFLKLVTEEISWHFVEHAHGDEIQDVSF